MVARWVMKLVAAPLKAPDMVTAAGRVCPTDYQLSPTAFDRGATREPDLDVLYVAGGLYGNLFALTQIEKLLDQELAGKTRLVLNGDFHWFDVEPEWFTKVHERTARHWLTRGNVETEMCRGGATDAGCGCAYPDSVPDDDVMRSNQIMQSLGQTARDVLGPAGLPEVAGLPDVMTVRVAGRRIGITHGDDQTLAGWSFAQDQLATTISGGLAGRMAGSNIDVFASSHTCLPVADTMQSNGVEHCVINNGSAGMANFAGTTFGVVSRIACVDGPPPPVTPLYEASVGPLRVSALPVVFDQQAWLARFMACWAPGSAARVSYLDRIRRGPDYRLSQAARGTFKQPVPVCDV